MPDLLGSPWRRRSSGQLAIVTAVNFVGIHLGGINDDGTPNDRTWTLDDEAELRRDWEPVRRAWVPVEQSEVYSPPPDVPISLASLAGLVAGRESATIENRGAFESSIQVRRGGVLVFDGTPEEWSAAHVEHPTPWRWKETPDRGWWMLVDAADRPLMELDLGPRWNEGEPALLVPSPYVRRVTELAPELEKVVREGMATARGCINVVVREMNLQPPGQPCGTCWACKSGAVLAELDKAKGGDRG